MTLLTGKEIEILRGYIEVAERKKVHCEQRAAMPGYNEKMFTKQAGWEQESIDLLKKVIRLMQ